MRPDPLTSLDREAMRTLNAPLELPEYVFQCETCGCVHLPDERTGTVSCRHGGEWYPMRRVRGTQVLVKAVPGADLLVQPMLEVESG